MLQLILLIIKIIGLILLTLLGIVLLLLLVILFVPIRYKVVVEQNDNFALSSRVSWMLHIIHGRIKHYDGKLHFQLRIFGIILFDNLRLKSPKKKRRKHNIRERNENVRKHKRKKVGNKNKRDGFKEVSDTNDSNEFLNELIHDAKDNLVEYNDNVIEEIKDNIIEDVKYESNDKVHKVSNEELKDGLHDELQDDLPEDHSKKKTNLFRKILLKIQGIIKSIKNIFINIRNKVIRVFGIFHNVKRMISKIHDFLSEEINQSGIKLTLSSLGKILKHIAPTKLKANVIFGTGDPCSTGQALGVASLLYGYYGECIQITPDFLNKRFEGKLYARGRIRLITLLIIVIKLILDKRFKQFKKNIIIFKEALYDR